MLVIGILATIAGIVESLVAGRQLEQRSFRLSVAPSLRMNFYGFRLALNSADSMVDASSVQREQVVSPSDQ